MKKRMKLLSAVLTASLCLSAWLGSTMASAGENNEECEQLVIAMGKDIGNDLNPHQYNGQMPVQDWVYDGLTTMVNGKAVGDLAESWDISEDGKEYTFHLRPGVKFNDGTDLNAEVVKKNFETVIAHRDRHSFIQCLFVINSIE